jgi:hypothetical protein
MILGVRTMDEQMTMDVGPNVRTLMTRGEFVVELVDRARHDRGFRAELRREPVGTVRRLGMDLYDSEWAGLRALLED